MLRRTIALFACMILCWISLPSNAAEISCSEGVSPNFFRGYLNGHIRKGDYEEIAALLKDNHPRLGAFDLNSPGGDVDEALKIGRLFRKYLISTAAPSQLPGGEIYSPWTDRSCTGQHCDTCASACALIWFGGVNRNGTVGLHRPRTDDPAFRGLSAAAASTVYRRWLADIAFYLDEMEVPRSITEAMIATSSSDIRWVDAIDDGLDQPPSIAEWADTSCPGGTLSNMARKAGHLRLTPQQREIGRKKTLCEASLFYDRRGRLEPP